MVHPFDISEVPVPSPRVTKHRVEENRSTEEHRFVATSLVSSGCVDSVVPFVRRSTRTDEILGVDRVDGGVKRGPRRIVHDFGPPADFIIVVIT